jgi:Flp pilus assembly protein TadB
MKGNNVLKIFIIVVVIAIVLWFINNYENFFNHQSNREERLKELKNEKTILENHRIKLSQLEDRIRKVSDRIWKRMVRLVLLFFILSLSPFALVYGFSSIEFALNVFSWSLSVYCLIYFFFTVKLFSLKEHVYDRLKDYSYKKVAGNRDAEYFASRHETIDDRIEQINLEIRQLESKQVNGFKSIAS